MTASETRLADLLRFEPEKGLIWLKDYRMVMLSACSLGALRKELVDTLGWEAARSLMKRFGYAAGLADGLALSERFPEATGARHMDLGPALHAIEGITRVVRIPEKTDIDLANGRFHVEAYWENSFEAEQHLELLGPSKEPACWTLAGYATGHSASAAGRRTVVVETECRAMGHERCRFTAALADEMPELARKEESDYRSEHLPAVLRDLHNTVKKHKRSLRSRDRKIERLKAEVERFRPRGRFVGASPELSTALDTAQAVAPYKATVLILGESGTGKELLAQFVHEQSTRADEAFVAVNCSALPENLQEAELFGHAKGAFTGATAAREGVFEAAHRGTLFLDEIGDLTSAAQTKMLRALQEGEIKRIGESRVRRVDTRIVAATNRDLEEMVREETFRQDLYYRLSVVSVTLPPLRSRGDDSLLLAEHFRAKYSKRFSKTVSRFAPEASRAIVEYPWPGNVRELENAVQRAVILAEGEVIERSDLALSVAPHRRPETQGSHREMSRQDPALAEVEDEAERIRLALKLAEGKRERAAALLGVSRTTLWRRMRSLSGVD